jgi:murein DD-endopeptidase MepM/ murein hydrolase activator NlpD
VEIKIDDGAGFSQFGQYSSSLSTYTVLQNETLFDIAYKYNIDPINLAKINGINSPYKVRTGQVLKLPGEQPLSGENATGNYTAADMDAGSKEIPSYQDEAAEKNKHKLDKELTEEFKEVILDKKTSAEAKKHEKSKDKNINEKGMTFNEQAEVLSKPKVTETAIGTPTKRSEIKESLPVKKHSKSTENAETKPAPSPIKSSEMIKPVDGEVVSRFGDIRDGVSNDGINIKATQGTKVKAAADGTVIYAGNKLDEEYGNVVIVQHSNGLITSYAHLNDIGVKKDAHVRAGEAIGTVGKTGDVTEPQLYFEVMKDKKPVNPSKYLKK